MFILMRDIFLIFESFSTLRDVVNFLKYTLQACCKKKQKQTKSGQCMLSYYPPYILSARYGLPSKYLIVLQSWQALHYITQLVCTCNTILRYIWFYLPNELRC